jgi:hypothetical protein
MPDVASVSFIISGGKGIRTPGLLIANETLYQLSYTPEYRGPIISTGLPAEQAVFAPFHSSSDPLRSTGFQSIGPLVYST